MRDSPAPASWPAGAGSNESIDVVMPESESLPLSESEQIALVRDSARRLLSHRWPIGGSLPLDADPRVLGALWTSIAQQGWTALRPGDPELGLEAILTLMQELGRAACPLPLMDAVLAHAMLGAAGSHAGRLLEEVEAGRAVVTWILADRMQPDGFGVQWSNGTLSGRAAFVENTEIATHLLVITGRTGEIAIVESGCPGVIVEPTPGLATPSLAEVRFDHASARLVDGLQDLERLPGMMRLLLAARAWGSTAYGLEIAADYAKIRKQFGRPIGQYQALQHKLADCLIAIEVCRLGLVRAGKAPLAQRHYCSALASALCARHLRSTMLELHHAFGGISFWHEHELPRHFHRVHGDLTRLDALRASRRQLADHVLAHGAVPPYSYGDAADALRTRVREWLGENWDGTYPPAVRHLPVNERKARPEFSRKLGAMGWLGMFWPREAAAPRRTALEHLAYEEELAYRDAPTYWHSAAANMIGPALERHGSSQQKRGFLPAIAAGDISFALGYSEPDHGSDLAGIRTSARRLPDGGWSVRGQKIFTSAASWATHIWMAVRTDPSCARHGGISVLMLPMDAPGISRKQMLGLSGHSAAVVFFDDVKAPADALVGEENGGWKVIMDALAFERVSMGALGSRARGYLDRLIGIVRAGSRDGRPLSDDSLMLDQLGELVADVEASRLLAVQNAQRVQQGEAPLVQAAILKVYSSELMERLCETAFDILGTGAALEAGFDSAAGDGAFEYGVRDALQYTIGGGTNEIQRSLIAQHGLGLPR